MDMELKERFITRWRKYFDSAELPICCYYTDEVRGAEPVKPASGHRCILGDLTKIRKGKSLYFDVESIGCFGGKRYLGFSQEIMPNFECFPGQANKSPTRQEYKISRVLRYKKTPELVKEMMEKVPVYKACKVVLSDVAPDCS